ncbi:Hint domain-containing protein [Rhodobacteraceae bacterium D3-12]|nr:Hint domain-containing protein [Rhodobacteraceae bacterium D3-12]
MAYTLDWSGASANGSYTLADGANTVGVTLSTTTNGAGQTATVATTGSPSETALWVSGLTDPVTTQMDFAEPVENLSFEIFDIDQAAGSWDDRLIIIATDAAGNEVAVNFSDLDGLHTASGNQLDADGNASTGVETSGAADSVTVSIPGPISSLRFIFDNGESATNSGLFGVSDITFDAAELDYIVEGTSGADTIDDSFLGDPEGDKIDNSDAADLSNNDVVQAGGGNDSVLSGLGDDSVEAGTGNDTVRGGVGDDTILGGAGDDSLYGNEDNDSIEGGDGSDSIYGETGDDYVSGGAGDDTVEGNEGSDTLYGGAGDDWLRGSYGDDALYGGTGADYLWGGFGDDTFHIENDFGNDTIEGENIAQVEGDTLDLSAVTDDLTVDLTHGSPEIGTFSDGVSTAQFGEIETIILGSGTDTLVLGNGSGADVVSGFAAPTLNGDGTYSGQDQLDVSTVMDWDRNPVDTDDVTVSDTNGDGTGDAVLTFPNGESLTLVGVSTSEVSSPEQLAAMGVPLATSDGIVSGTVGSDTIDVDYAGDPDGDSIDAGDAHLPGEAANDDIIYAGFGDDSVFAGLGDDELFGESGNDHLFGESGQDALFGGAGDDVLDGGTGSDTVEGGDGADVITLAEGDSVSGGDGDDLFLVSDLGEAGAANATVVGGEGDEALGDTLDFQGQTHWDDVTLTNSDPGVGGGMSGNAVLADGSVVSFSEIETLIICFTEGTRIATAQGLRAVQDLQIGDLVVTRDHGLQPVRWVGQRSVAAVGSLAPVRFDAGALGNQRPLLVSPQHRMLIRGGEVNMLFGAGEVLASAKHLINGGSIREVPGGTVTYVHLLFDGHEIIYAEGTPSESFYPGDTGLGAVDEAAREELFTLFPELRDAAGPYGDTARMCLRRHEAQLMRL